MVIELLDARSALAAAWLVRERLPPRLRGPLELSLIRAAGALDGEVPKLRAAHLYPRPAELPPEPSEGAGPEAEEAWQIAMNALAVAIRHLFRPEVPLEKATLSWLGLMSVNVDDAHAVVARAEALLGHPLDTLDDHLIPAAGELEDPYDDPHLALVPYLRDRAREEECESEVGPAEAAMTLGPEPVVGSRETLGLSFLRWKVTERGIEALVRCRLHALSHEDWVLVVPTAMRSKRRRVRSFLNALRSAVQGGAALAAIRHLRPPRPVALARLLERLFSPSALTEVPDGDAADFEQVLSETRFLGGVVAELEEVWPLSPFRRVVREAGSVKKAMELVAPTILEIASEQFQGDLTITIDIYDECFEIRRLRKVVAEVSRPLYEIAATDPDANQAALGSEVAVLLDKVRTESWQP